MSKKLIVTAAVLFTGMLFSSNAFAQCETTLVATLQSEFDISFPGEVLVINEGSIVTVTGPMSAVGSSAGLSYINEYNTNASSCPTAPPLYFVITSSPTSGDPYVSGRPTTPTVQ